MASHVTVIDGTWPNIMVNGVSINDSRYDQYIDQHGVFSFKGVIIKPSGSVRVGETKVHPSGLIQVGNTVHVQGSIRSSIPPSAWKSAKSRPSAEVAASQSASRSVLSDTSSKANVQRKRVTISEKDGGSVLDKSAQAAGSKRKSIEGEPESAKKQKTSSTSSASTLADSRSVPTGVPSAPKDIHTVELPGQWSDDVPVYESCGQIRRKIHVHLAQHGNTKAQFCRDLQNQLFSGSGPARIQSSMVDAFLKKSGSTSGCTSSVYYTAYVFFEKWRIVQNEAKSKHRLEMEKVWPGGVERDRDDSNRGIWCTAGTRPHQDAYGRWKIR